MLRRIFLTLLLLILLLAGGAWFVFQHMSISALAQPSRIERFLAAQAKHRLVARAAQSPLPAETPNTPDNAEDGHTNYGSLCAGCHGYDGRTPTRLGNSVYPHAPSLAASGPQNYSDPELFVVIHDGIRLSAMPGFGNTQSAEQIWNLVHYVRTLPNAAPPRR